MLYLTKNPKALAERFIFYYLGFRNYNFGLGCKAQACAFHRILYFAKRKVLLASKTNTKKYKNKNQL